jgi:hypothetical protein
MILFVNGTAMLQSCRTIRQISGYSLARTLTVPLFCCISSLSLQQARSTFYVVEATLAQFGVHAGKHEIQYTECRMNTHMRIYMHDITRVFLYTSCA